MAASLYNRLSSFLQDLPHPSSEALISTLAGKTSLSSSGFPYISESSFGTFLSEVPHLFQDGNQLLDWMSAAERKVEGSSNFSTADRDSIDRALKVIRNMVFSAAICAPCDLWILKHVLSTHHTTGVAKFFQTGAITDADQLAKHLDLNAKHLAWDLSLLYTRGYLDCRDQRYRIARNAQSNDVLHHCGAVDSEFLRDIVPPIAEALTVPSEFDLVRSFLQMPHCTHKNAGWVASHRQLEIGYRLLPVVLALHLHKIGKGIPPGTSMRELVPHLPGTISSLLREAGIIADDLRLTVLGCRVLERGPGPFGIIHAYVPYMQVLEDKLRGKGAHTSVQRGKNISASQDANRKTFQTANDALDRFCSDFGFRYEIYIEHALGLGEATRQRLQKNGEQDMQYFGADLEDAAIDRAVELQNQRVLPQNMIFIRRADIANPQIVIDAVRAAGFSTENAVMFVGNGFHEIRAQTNEKIIDVFRTYCNAGILTVFTEESALSDADLRSTAWNTYHAGFRYVHELSGQGLRPAAGTDRNGRHSWKICASLGGYAVLPKYSTHTRTIFPFPRKGGYNPPISMTYFCVPAERARSLGWYPLNWRSTTRSHIAFAQNRTVR